MTKVEEIKLIIEATACIDHLVKRHQAGDKTVEPLIVEMKYQLSEFIKNFKMEAAE